MPKVMVGKKIKKFPYTKKGKKKAKEYAERHGIPNLKTVY